MFRPQVGQTYEGRWLARVVRDHAPRGWYPYTEGPFLRRSKAVKVARKRANKANFRTKWEDV